MGARDRVRQSPQGRSACLGLRCRGSPLIMSIIGAGNAVIDDGQAGGDDDHHAFEEVFAMVWFVRNMYASF